MHSPRFLYVSSYKPQIAKFTLRFLKETPVPREENRGLFQKPGMHSIPGITFILLNVALVVHSHGHDSGSGLGYGFGYAQVGHGHSTGSMGWVA